MPLNAQNANALGRSLNASNTDHYVYHRTEYCSFPLITHAIVNAHHYQSMSS